MSAGTYSELLTALGKNESGNNYGFVSSVGYLGRFQFGEEALKAVGFYNGDSTWGIDFIGSWTDKAASFGVYDKNGFLNSPAAQDAAQQAWFANIHDDLKKLDLERYEGQTIGGVAISKSGLIAGAHLVGVWNLKTFLETGGAVDTRDPYGTPVSEYVHRFGGFDTPFGSSPVAPTPTPTPTPGVNGAETLVGGSGPDELHGYSGDDALQGGDGADRLFGGDGQDTITGGGGANYLRGDAGNDQITGGWEFDDINGNQGDDVLKGGSGDDWVVGGQDNDLQFGEDGADIVWGNMGNDTLHGGEGNDQVRGGQGEDVIYGGGGDDWISGDRGSDVVSGGGGADVFHTFSGAGQDRVLDFNPWEGDRVNVLPGSHYSLAQVGSDTVIDLGGGDQMVLVNVQLSSLQSGWIF